MTGKFKHGNYSPFIYQYLLVFKFVTVVLKLVTLKQKESVKSSAHKCNHIRRIRHYLHKSLSLVTKLLTSRYLRKQPLTTVKYGHKDIFEITPFRLQGTI